MVSVVPWRALGGKPAFLNPARGPDEGLERRPHPAGVLGVSLWQGVVCEPKSSLLQSGFTCQFYSGVIPDAGLETLASSVFSGLASVPPRVAGTCHSTLGILFLCGSLSRD